MDKTERWEKSPVDPELKRRALQLSQEGRARVFTDPLASPTGFPLKVAQIESTLSEASMFDNRPRICDLGYLRHLYRGERGQWDAFWRRDYSLN